MLHFVLASYLGDRPEAEDLLYVKRSVQKNCPRHNGLAERTESPHGSNAPLRRFQGTINVLNTLDSGSEK